MARQPIEHRHAEGFLEPGFPVWSESSKWSSERVTNRLLESRCTCGYISSGPRSRRGQAASWPRSLNRLSPYHVNVDGHRTSQLSGLYKLGSFRQAGYASLDGASCRCHTLGFLRLCGELQRRVLYVSDVLRLW